nr:MAG TPA_asm: hypothetical protein [Caudoviricetes sp.]
MLICYHAEARGRKHPPTFKQRPPGITPWWLTNRYCVIPHKTDLYITGQCRRVHKR